MDPAAVWKPCLEHAAISDLGLRRANNQDSYTIFLASTQQVFTRRGHLFMVADGMGAHAAGELASKIATDVVPLTYHKLREKSPPDALAAAILDANTQIYSRGQASPDFKGMGTTASVLILLPQGALLAHVGDSRAYRLRGGRLEQLTFDHSLVWELKAAGHQFEEQYASYVSKNIITRSLGPNITVAVDLEGPHPIEPGDTFLLCSDGLSGQVSDEEIGAVLTCLPPEEAVQTLVNLANLRGGPDNITIVVAKVLGPLTAGTAASGPTDRAAPLRPVHPLLWTLLGATGLATLGFLAMGQWGVALGTLLVTALCGIAALVQRYGGGEPSWAGDPQRFGRGPYVTADCTPNEDLLAKWSVIVQELRDAAEHEKWNVDWSGFHPLLAQAESARARKDYPAAAREYLHAINYMMQQLKHQRPDKEKTFLD
ncbi:MAG: serine/threonine-protein phosphatase [Pirellulales bacterium]|nr:serine/threonine-protein phosphatase [Pirellulales bacterium]